MNDLVVREAADKPAVVTRQYVIMTIENEFFGIDIAHVNSIINYCDITSMPNTPEYLMGIINLRGRIVPVISLRRRMHLDDDVISKDTRIVVLEMEDESLLGVIADAVTEVAEISSNDIQAPSPLLKSPETFISGIGKKDEALVSIFEVKSIALEELEKYDDLAEIAS